MDIEMRVEQKRGCGYREGGGKYLVSGDLMMPCGRLPFPLDVRPTCHAGIKPSHGWTWVNGHELMAGKRCETPDLCGGCYVAIGSPDLDRIGLLWIGERYYRMPEHFTDEVRRMGVSRRIAGVPRDFVLGKTCVLLAHRKCIKHPDDSVGPCWTAGIFHAFRPTAIEYVVGEGDSQEKLEGLAEQGFTLVRVERADEPAWIGSQA